MKKKLNFLCIMLLILMVAGMVIACLAGFSDFKRGYEEGVNATTSSTNDIIVGFVVLAAFVVYAYAFACYVLLRTVGWCIVVTTTVMCSVISFSSINLLDAWTDGISIIADGVFILIMAEVFSIGLKLKEEQDLTI